MPTSSGNEPWCLALQYTKPEEFWKLTFLALAPPMVHLPWLSEYSHRSPPSCLHIGIPLASSPSTNTYIPKMWVWPFGEETYMRSLSRSASRSSSAAPGGSPYGEPSICPPPLRRCGGASAAAAVAEAAAEGHMPGPGCSVVWCNPRGAPPEDEEEEPPPPKAPAPRAPPKAPTRPSNPSSKPSSKPSAPSPRPSCISSASSLSTSSKCRCCRRGCRRRPPPAAKSRPKRSACKPAPRNPAPILLWRPPPPTPPELLSAARQADAAEGSAPRAMASITSPLKASTSPRS
mmetsp:Transcript_137717/g.439959  ORF Transcript_137717/g.439959 Transcript_137717/m.439959 type:complete len:289 (-) Transcript_137717:1084-1950(-)